MNCSGTIRIWQQNGATEELAILPNHDQVY